MFINKIHTQFEGTPYAFRMIPIEGNIGKEPFDMGEGSNKHQVQVSDFYMSEHLVTQRLWAYIMSGTNKEYPSNFKGRNRPVERVSWNDIAHQFLPKFNKVTKSMRPAGTMYRLPTEAEWEYAARGGKYWAKYPFDYSGSDKLDEVGWHDENSYNETQSMGLKTPNLLGLYDISGNVSEWCQDCYDNEFHKEAAALQPNPCNTAESSYRVPRGGSYFDDAPYCHPANRNDYKPNSRNDDIGFRLVLSSIIF
jgi:formylglycine-generating enzyme required for sulfatase activity